MFTEKAWEEFAMMWAGSLASWFIIITFGMEVFGWGLALSPFAYILGAALHKHYRE